MASCLLVFLLSRSQFLLLKNCFSKLVFRIFLTKAGSAGDKEIIVNLMMGQ